jgi:hypothetical protein
MLSFAEITEYLDTTLQREIVDCKKYDYTAIKYTQDTIFTVTINTETVSTNINSIILYNVADVVRLVCLTPHLTKYNYNIRNINSIAVTTND